jgi:glutaredoxin
VVVHDGRRNAGAAPATVSGEHLFDKATGAMLREGEAWMLRPASQETCLERNVHGRGVRKVAIDVRNEVRACRYPRTFAIANFGVKSMSSSYFPQARVSAPPVLASCIRAPGSSETPGCEAASLHSRFSYGHRRMPDRCPMSHRLSFCPYEEDHEHYRLQQAGLRPVHCHHPRARSQGIATTSSTSPQDAAAYELVQGLGYRQVPVVIAGEQHWAGFRPDMISALA